MNVRIVETIGKNEGADVQKWYEAKVKELAHFFANKVKNQVIYTDSPTFAEQKELEVMVK